MKRRWPVRALSSRARSFSSVAAAATAPPQPSSFALKNVTRSNFGEALADLRRLVGAADFVAVDLEMSGVTSAPWRDSFEFDRFDVRYLKVKDSAEKFAVLQFGVCPFRWDHSNNCFVAHPHNFYIFPRQEFALDGPSYEFICQTTSIDFLAKHQFDFNACIHEGVSYLSRVQENEALRRLSSKYKDELSESWYTMEGVKDKPLTRMADVLFTERMKIRISEWHDGLQRDISDISKSQEGSHDLKRQFQTIFFKLRPALLLNGFTSHQLRLIKLVTRKHFEDLVYIHTNGEDSCVQHLIVYTDSKLDRGILMKEVRDEVRKEAETKINAAVGFRHVIDLLSSERKLIVGHNCFLDIAHIHSKFLGPLPRTAEEFCSSFHKYFPYIIDTKILLNANGVLQHSLRKSGTSLCKAFSLLCPQFALSVNSSSLSSRPCVRVEVQVDDMRSCKWNSGAKHEAGYDAFMTGCIFVQACSHLGIDFKSHSPPANLAHSEKLQKHINLLYLSWVRGDIIDLRTGNQTSESSGYSLNKRYPKILFSNVVLIWGFPSKLKATGIKDCIHKVFGPGSITSIYHLDKTAVFLHFSKAELASDFLNLKETLERNNDPISVLHPFSELLEGGNTCAASYEIYKDICSSPVSKILFADQAAAIGIKWKTKLVESKIQAENKQEHGGFCNEEIRIGTHSAEKSKKEMNNVTNDSSCGQFSAHGIIDSLFTAKTQLNKPIRTY